MKGNKEFFLLLTGWLFCFGVWGQAVVVGGWEEEKARVMQLMGQLDPSISFTVRPLQTNRIISNPCIYEFVDSNTSRNIGQSKQFANSKRAFYLFPISLIQQYNSHHPYGWNDGAMIAAKGYQTLFSAGVYASFGPLSVQLKPEFVYASNPDYETNVAYGSNGSGKYQQLFSGQSNISLSVGPTSIGMSTENLWWGPGRHSSLLMSNNAPGFLHGFFRSNKPWQTAIGSFEWQLIGGKLTSDDYWAYENRNLKKASLPQDSRYLSAYVISYHPKWVPGLFLGMTRGIQVYQKDMSLSGNSFVSKYVPIIFKPLQKQDAQGDDTLRTDQLASFFLRWVLPKSRTEFYIEYGFNDYGQNARDYIEAPTHSAAYLAGFKTILPLSDASYMDIGFELTQMSQTPDYLVRDAGNWYVHGQVLQGYTHQNQILGAGAGLGCNVQTATSTWVKGHKQLGLLLERVERDPQYHQNKWIDLSIGILPQYKYGNMVFSGKFQFINSSQYAWEKDSNRFNLHSRISVQYLL